MAAYQFDETEEKAFKKQWRTIYMLSGLALFCIWMGCLNTASGEMDGLLIGAFSFIVAVVLLYRIILKAKALLKDRESGLEACQGLIVRKAVVRGRNSLAYSLVLDDGTAISVDEAHFMQVAEGQHIVAKYAGHALFIASLTKTDGGYRPQPKKAKEKPLSKPIVEELKALRKAAIAPSDIFATAGLYFFAGAMITVLPLYSIEVGLGAAWAEPIYETGKWWMGGLGIAAAIGQHALAYLRLLRLAQEGQMEVFDTEILRIDLSGDYLQVMVATGDWIAFDIKNADAFKIGDWLRIEEFDLNGKPTSIGIQLMDNQYVRPLYYLPYLESVQQKA